MAMAPICTLTAAVRWLPMSPVLPPPPASSCATCTSPSPAWKIFFSTIPEGACANELESLFCHARAGRSRRPPQLRGALVSDLFAAADVCVYLRPRDGRQRLHAAFLQKPPAPGDHGHLHGRYRHLGRRYAIDRGISVHARDRRPPTRSDGDFLAGNRESRRWHTASARRGLHGHSRCLVAPPPRRGFERAPSYSLCARCLASRSFLRDRRPRPRLQHAADPHRPDVQPHRRPHDFFWLHLLSLERARQIPHPAKSRAREPPRLRQRRPSRHDDSPVPASALGGGSPRAGVLQRAALRRRPPQFPRQIRQLSS